MCFVSYIIIVCLFAKIGFQHLVLRVLLQASYGFLPYLAHSFSCQTILLADFFHRAFGLIDAIESLNDISFAIVQNR